MLECLASCDFFFTCFPVQLWAPRSLAGHVLMSAIGPARGQHTRHPGNHPHTYILLFALHLVPDTVAQTNHLSQNIYTHILSALTSVFR